MSIEESKDKYRVVDRKLISTYRDGYIGKEVYEVTLNNGKTRRVERITKAGRDGDAAVIVPITVDNKFVVIVESRPNTKDTTVRIIVRYTKNVILELSDAANSLKAVPISEDLIPSLDI